ncbi:MAG: SOS response-associated peptidase family protein [Erysipelotrichaceae bacterium]|nr:SOS response-associated peptidase family protein [Erysipelotrichaceae bacterium]
MCGRFYVEEDEELLEYYDQLVKQYGTESVDALSKDEVFPSENALVLVEQDDTLTPRIMKWGYPKWDKGIIINTRIDSLHKPIYKENYEKHRCVICASGFYEWNSQHQRYAVSTGQSVLYFAGIYDKDTNAFSILTTDSIPPLSSIHHRSPVILTRNQAYQYCKYPNHPVIHTNPEGLWMKEDTKTA